MAGERVDLGAPIAPARETISSERDGEVATANHRSLGLGGRKAKPVGPQELWPMPTAPAFSSRSSARPPALVKRPPWAGAKWSPTRRWIAAMPQPKASMSRSGSAAGLHQHEAADAAAAARERAAARGRPRLRRAVKPARPRGRGRAARAKPRERAAAR